MARRSLLAGQAEECSTIALPSAILLGRTQEGSYDHYGTPDVDEKLQRIALAIAEDSLSEDDLSLLGSIFDRSILRLTDPLILLAALALRERSDRLMDDEKLSLRAAEGVRNALSWYLDPSRRLIVPARHLLQRASALFEEEELKRWRGLLKRGEEEQREIGVGG